MCRWRAAFASMRHCVSVSDSRQPELNPHLAAMAKANWTLGIVIRALFVGLGVYRAPLNPDIVALPCASAGRWRFAAVQWRSGLWVVHHDGFVYAVAGISATLKWLGIDLFLLGALFALVRKKLKMNSHSNPAKSTQERSGTQ